MEVINATEEFSRWGKLSGQDIDWFAQEPISKGQLLLRPLFDLTEQEASELWDILGWNESYSAARRLQVLTNEFKGIGDDDGELRGYFSDYLCIIPKMLEWGFDLWGLIDEGLAIDKTTMK